MKYLRIKYFATALLLIAMGGGALSAKESANWIVGVGVGYGATKIDIKYPESTRNQLGFPIGGAQNNWLSYNPGVNTSATSWGVAYEILVGYKHFVNEWIGFRYYANVGAQHYKDKNFSNDKNTIGVIEYTANADLLINFYDSPDFSFGIFGGFGVGGATFDSPTLNNYESDWGAATDSTQLTEAIYKGIGEVYKHHFSASASVGVRFNFFQQIRGAGQVVCSAGSDGRRSCKKPIASLEHSIEVNAKFPLITYYATKAGDTIAVRVPNQLNYLRGIQNRPGYEIKNPYKFTLRYIIAF